MNRRLGLTLMAALVVVAVGLLAMTAAGAPRSLVVAQGLAGLFAVALAVGVAVWRPSAQSRETLIAVLATLAALISPWLHPGLDGVHRWISLGPIQIQPAALALPVIVWFAAGRADRLIGPAALSAAALICALQPDQQATAAVLTAAIAVLLLHQPTLAWLAAVVVATAALVVAGLADQPAPVAYVEEVLQRSLAAAWPLGLAAGLALTAVPALVLTATSRARGPTAVALAAMWIGVCAASLSQLYPTPVIGFGLSWVIGWGLSLGLSAAGGDRQAKA